MLKYFIAKLKSNKGEVRLENSPTTVIDIKPEAKKTAPKIEGAISDLDFSDVPESIRQDVISKVSEKVKLYDSGFRSKTEELSKERKSIEQQRVELNDLVRLRDEIQGDPALSKKITQVINNYRAGIRDEEKSIDKNLKLLDQILDTTDDASQKEQLRQMREIIKQESGSPELTKELIAMKEELASLREVASAGITGRIESNMDKLEAKYGKELVEKYSNNIIQMAKKYPSYVDDKSFPKLLYQFATSEELENALLESAKSSKQRELTRKEHASAVSSGVSEVRRTEMPKDKSGRVDWKNLFNRMRDEGKFKIT